jgi:beta-phosphoglucomutase
MIRAVIFDFNGVLVDDEPIHFDLFREVLAQEGVTLTEREYHERYLGYDDRGCFAAALRAAGQSFDPPRLDELVARKAKRYIALAEKGMPYFPDVAETLEGLANRWPVAICSGALRAEIETVIGRLGLLHRLAAVVAAEDVDACKPDPAGYLKTLEVLRAQFADAPAIIRSQLLQAHQCLVVEDSLAGVISARDAGMRAVGITHTYTEPELRAAGAEAVVDGLRALTPDWIERQFGASPDGKGQP